MSSTNGAGVGPRTSSAGSSERRPSNRTTRSSNPQEQASQIEKSVTHLLVATKQLLETLTQWSRGTATENEVSDVYVRLGYEFNIACRSFTTVGIDTSDLGPVPDTLRTILEDTLSQEASQQSLDRYLPRIRDIIINLLHGLKRKQQRLRQRTGSTREGSFSSSSLRQGSSSSNGTIGDAAARQSSRSSLIPPRTDSAEDSSLPPAYTDSPVAATGRMSPTRRESQISRNRPIPSTAVEAPPPPNDALELVEGVSTSGASQQSSPSDPPKIETSTSEASLKPPAREADALAQLQRGGELERRASRRFSAYQIQKHLGTTSIGMPAMPQHSPIPNRGRDARESVYTSRMRGSQLHSRDKSKQSLSTDTSPNRQPSVRTKPSDSGSLTTQAPSIETPTPQETPKEPTKKADEYTPNVGIGIEIPSSRMSANLSGPTDFDLPSFAPEASPVKDHNAQVDAAQPQTEDGQPGTKVEEADAHADVNDAFSRRDSTGPLILFLQYKKRVKKCVLSEGYAELTLARLQLAFIEKFAWNTHSNGIDLPEIYIQDAESGIKHELEDLNDIKENSILVLNTDDLDEVKRHFDDGLGGLKSVMDLVRAALTDNQSVLQRVSDRQQEASKELARIANTPPAIATPASPTMNQPRAGIPTIATRGTPSQITELQSLRREFAVLKQTYNTHMSDMETSMTALRGKAASIKDIAAKASKPSLEGESGRTYVNKGKKQLQENSEKIINRVDDLQDIVEDLRKDIATRGVKPLPRQIEQVHREIAQATADLRELREYMKKEKPIWKKVSEKELEAVMDDQNVLKLQEELAADLEDDLDKAAQTFSLVEQASKQGTGGTRQTSRTLGAAAVDVDPLKAKDSLLGEVKALQPNHESRLEAIERAEKARILELQSRQDGAFKQELGSFVEEGRLKKTGGVEEVERQRLANDDTAIRAIWTGNKAAWEPPLPAEGEEASASASGLTLTVPPSADDDPAPSPEAEFVEAPEGPQP